ncbi:hypothetical protein EVAR_73635_1 [Eumeta japonica]|uniref:Uncharacterized protein n=1 Tax=Eumeta variegata TaxID=151549 RepID=A0A4C1SCN4_EUMVA|nr:hypothetical protein EVAR_73635_1 [Eumeta japonica]
MERRSLTEKENGVDPEPSLIKQKFNRESCYFSSLFCESSISPGELNHFCDPCKSDTNSDLKPSCLARGRRLRTDVVIDTVTTPRTDDLKCSRFNVS